MSFSSCVCPHFMKCKRTFKYLMCTVIVYSVTFSIVLPILCQRLPYSRYFMPNKDQDFQLVLEANDNRIKASESYLKTLDPASTLGKYSLGSEAVHIVVGVVTVARTKNRHKDISPKYLTQTLSRVEQGLRRQNFGHNNKIFICNVDVDPADNTEAIELSKYFPMVNNSKTDFKQKPDSLHNILTKENDDYAFCLNVASTYKSKYVLLLQDDALPHENFYEILNDVLEHQVESYMYKGEYVSRDEKWAFLKLNFPTPHAGFTRNFWFAMEGIAITSTAASIVALAYDVMWRQRSKARLQWTYYVFLASFVYIAILCHVIGRQMFLQYRGLISYMYSIRPATSCCITAVLYPSSEIPDIVNYLNDVEDGYAVDFALADYVTAAQSKQYLLVPNLFTHIGMFSSLHTKTLSFVEFYIP
ncbi:post-GPI attachment to proteins factor 4-like [Ptychodera flava]|uniref:post-GPI attachment to proteins factor 4-like n=1 Tax=Ptychodera flava TaxID=63121 RepID=UPI00396A67C1